MIECNSRLSREAQYKKVKVRASVVVLEVVLLVFLAYPTLTVKSSYEKTKVQDPLIVEAVPETHQEKKIVRPPERPSVPVEDETGEVSDTVTIPPTVGPWVRRPFKPQPPSEPSEFVAYDTVAVLIKLVQPIYPEIARKAGIEGMVILKIQIDETGKVVDAKVLQSLGAGCDEAAIAAAMRCKFKPAMQRDKPVKVWMSYPVRFRLKEAKFK